MATASVNGVELDYEEAGAGAPVLLIHGTAARMWGDSFARLSERHRVIAYDRRSFGRSNGDSPDAIQVHADDAAALIGSLSAEPAIVVGWSMGGVIALDLAARHPEVVERLVLLEPALHMKRRPTFKLARMLMRAQIKRRRDERAAAELFLRWVFAQRSLPDAFDQLPTAVREQCLANASAILGDVDNGTGEQLSRSELAKITCPVTLLYGDLSDPAFERAARRAESLLTGVRARQVSGSGHAMQIDKPDAVAEAVG